MAEKKEWMLGLPGHTSVVTLEDVVLLVKGGQLRPTDLVKRLGQPWRAANEVPELSEYFVDPSRPAPAAPPPLRVASSPPPIIEKPKTTRHVPKADPPKPTSRKIPRTSPATSRRPASTTRRAVGATPAPETKSATDPAATPVDTKPPSDTKPPAAETRASGADTKPPQETKAPAAATKPAAEPPKKTRAIPKPRAKEVPRLEPMVGKYYSPVDLLRSASFSFDPKKLFFAAAMLVPLMTVAWLMRHFGAVQAEDSALGSIFRLFAVVWVVLGLAFVLVALAYVTRRQLEASEYSLAGVISYTGSNVLTAVVFPMLVMIPSLLAVGLLWLLGLVRDMGSASATILKIAYIVPMALSFVGVIGVLLYQLGCMYVPASAAIEGLGLTGAVMCAWKFIRRQWGRVVLHWLIVTVAFGVIAAVCLGLAWLAMQVPEWTFGVPPSQGVADAWDNFEGLMVIYRGIAYGLGLALPMSMLSTLGTLSYVSLRHPGSEQLATPSLEETSGIPVQGPRATTVPPPDATHPAETRPAPADYTGEDSKPGSPVLPETTPALPESAPVSPEPAAPPRPPEISDDSDEQPVVKDEQA